MKLDHFILSGLIISFVIVAGTFIFGDMINNYDLNASTSKFTPVYNRINETYAIAEGAKTAVLDSEIDSGSPWESMVKGAYKAVRLVTKSIELLGDIIAAVASELGIPAWTIQFAMTAIIIIVIFGLIYLWFNTK